MAEFDSTGFKAVANFFGQNDTNITQTDLSKKKSITSSTKEKGQNNNNNNNNSNKKRDRLGLGAPKDDLQNKHSSKNELDTDDVKNKILSIGKKRKNALLDEYDDTNDKKHTRTDNSDEDSEDEEEGRTSAIKEKQVLQTKAKLSNPTASSAGTEKKSKKKKKAGKKERLATKLDQTTEMQEGEVLESSQVDHQNDTKEHVDEEVNNNDATPIQELSPQNTNSNNNPKRKRPKIRSKQKNIRKDNRTTNEKPQHLRFSTKGDLYAGRPLTKETRKVLNLPESKSSLMKRKQQQDKGDVDDNNHGHDSDVKMMNQEDSTLVMPSLGIDSLLNEYDDVGVKASVDGDDNGHTNLEPSEKKAKKKNKIKKSKYKNLRV